MPKKKTVFPRFVRRKDGGEENLSAHSHRLREFADLEKILQKRSVSGVQDVFSIEIFVFSLKNVGKADSEN